MDIEKLRNKEAKSIEQWYLKYVDDIYTFIYYRVGRNKESAIDIVEDTFMSALERINNYNSKRGDMLTWLRLLARNCIKKTLKAKERYQSLELYWEQLDGELARGYTKLYDTSLPTDIVEQDETNELVKKTLTNLPSKYKCILEEYYYAQKSIKSIAFFLDIKENAAKALLHRARIAFKNTFNILNRSNYFPE
ncbi:MAG: sigma-70 family RNA polymerase sigma factor [Phycisphaerae bacterium]|nr:sigma-70 family RNA polymerase sigma factor [Phycisphaerae bacterium]